MFFELPPDVPSDKFQSLVEELTDKARQIGLYVNAVSLHVTEEEEEGEYPQPKKHQMLVQFMVGDHAFSKAVQDPETDKFNDEFRTIESGSLNDTVEDILRKINEDIDPDDGEGASV